MSIVDQTIIELDFWPDSPPAVVGTLATGQNVHIQLWENGDEVSIASSGCSEINGTGRYSWSTSGIPVLTSSRQQFHWRMSDGINIDEGDFILTTHENQDGGMPSINDKDSYIIQN